MDDKETPRKTEQKDTMTIYNADGSTTEIENPFLPMQLQIAIEQAGEDRRKSQQALIDYVLAETKAEQEEKQAAFEPHGNRHERRKQAAITRKAGR